MCSCRRLSYLEGSGAEEDDVGWALAPFASGKAGYAGCGGDPTHAARVRGSLFMIAAEIGAAIRPPVAEPSGTMARGRSNPIHSPATKSGVTPTNQALVVPFVVPVFPATGPERATRSNSCPSRPGIMFPVGD